MPVKEEIKTRSGVVLSVEKNVRAKSVELSVRMQDGKKCLLHWGLSRHPGEAWRIPPQSAWPAGSRAVDDGAVQTLLPDASDPDRATIRLDSPLEFSFVDFALYFPGEERWDNNSGQNYRIRIPRADAEGPRVSPMEQLKKGIDEETICYAHVHHIENEEQLAVVVDKSAGQCHVSIATDVRGPLILHWGAALTTRYEWQPPDASIFPAHTSVYDNKAAQTPFREHEGCGRVDFKMAEADAPPGIAFVLYLPDSGRWIKDHGRNFYVPIAGPEQHEGSLDDAELAAMADEIIEKEMSRNSWTLMHRFNLCFDLLDRATGHIGAEVLIFVWLRYSALRQLDWQRNYNTKPRELGHAMDRLTGKLGELYREEPADREWIRLILTTLGRGSDAQRVRDEVLHIMHRHRIKEVSGHFMEEWHQKLHNNTTPDDVVICEAYLEFLRSDGDLGRFYARLEEEGVTKERLESYERPIRSAPDFVPHLKDPLIRDFEHFLGILKEVHSGTDLGTAIHNARYLLDDEMRGRMDYVWTRRNDPTTPLTALVEEVTKARRCLRGRLTEGSASEIRDRLFLDLALEDFLRALIERSLDSQMAVDEMERLMGMMMGNITFSRQDESIDQCLRQWNRLMERSGENREWALQAKAILDRLAQALGAFIDRYHRLLQPKAEILGKAFHADSWTITLFAEEIIRGRPEFALSMLLRYLDPLLRKDAHLGNWQIISRGTGAGRVKKTSDMKSIQGMSFPEPVVLITDVVVGNEDIPEGVVAVLTTDTTDIVSHVAIRARNAQLLFATCYDSVAMERLKSLDGKWLEVSVNAAGDVTFAESRESADPQKSRRAQPLRVSLARRKFTLYAVSSKNFSEENVGGKSNNIARLQGKLPEWMVLPNSAALPFGVFEKVLEEPSNGEVASRYEHLIKRLGEAQEGAWERILGELRGTILRLDAPQELVSSLRSVMKESGLRWPERWSDAWTCIKQVWGSKWNERAYLSRRAMQIPHDDLFMAVLVQQVVEADYSFVIHTVNPFSGDRDEIYAEVVLGLGEALVANYPGRALGFTCTKGSREPKVLSFPSKMHGLYGGGLIFRSDSNGEDLVHYAGAGLYDSYMLPSAEKIALDYTAEPLVWDAQFRNDRLVSIARIGEEIEKATGSPQDIEGAYANGSYYVVQTRPQVGIDGIEE